MKVVHLLPALEQGGVETVVCDLNRVIVRSGWTSTVISQGGRLVAQIEADGGRHLRLDLKSKNPLTYPARVLKLRRLIAAEKPDLVCVHSRVPAWLYVGVRRLDAILRTNRISSIPWITYAHGANSVSRYSEVMTKGDLIVTPSRFLADYLRTSYGTSEEKIRVVPNAVDTQRFDPSRVDQTFMAEKRTEWGLREGDHVQMVIGRITPVKGLDELIRKFAEDANPRHKLVIVGGADKHHVAYLKSLQALATGAAFPDAATNRRVVFAGPQTKIPECLALADELVSANTTKPETFGLSVVEAYAMNKPVRAKRFGGVAEVMAAVEQAGCGTLREAVTKLYGIDRYAKETLSVYREASNMV